MSVTKKIFFDGDQIIKNATIKFIYCGDLFQKNSEEVHIHYGYGLLWSNVSEMEMKKTENGFEAIIEIKGEDTFNCCFKNEKGEWDNNEAHNFTFEIKIPELALAKSQENNLPAKKLSKTYLFGKKLKVLFYKVITYVPHLLGSSYKRKGNDDPAV